MIKLIKHKNENDVCIPLNIPKHFLRELAKIDEGRDISVEKRILIAVAYYLIQQKSKNNKEKDN